MALHDFPPGWDEARVRRLIQHYECMAEDQLLAEDEAKRKQWRSQYPGYCSFCRKSHKDAGPLVEGPDFVYICYPCILLCKNIVEVERKRLGIETPS